RAVPTQPDPADLRRERTAVDRALRGAPASPFRRESGLLGFLGVELRQVEILELLEVLGGQAAEAGRRDRGVGVLVLLGPGGAGTELLGGLALGRLQHAHLGLELGQRVVLAVAA